MPLKPKYLAKDLIPAEHVALYVERDGAWLLDVEPTAPPPLVLPPRREVPREKRTVRDEMAAYEDRVASFRLESDVRRIARGLGASRKFIEDAVVEARAGFRMVEGRAVPVAEDGRTVVQLADGSRPISVEEWIERVWKNSPERPAPRADAASDDASMPDRNPYSRKHWNLTEQMRLRKVEPERAASLKKAAWVAEG